jgi:uncharacterized protein (TIRG00374 family)
MNKAQKKWLFISVDISVVALVVMLLLTFDTETLVALEKCNPWYIFFGFLSHILSIVFWALRIQIMCWSLGYRVPFFHSINLICANMLIAAVTPSQVGGEAMRAYELYKSDVPTADATAVVLMERVFDGIVLCIGTVIGVYLLGRTFNHLNFPPMMKLARTAGTELIVYHLGFELYGDGGESIDFKDIQLHRYVK